jgi:hypothetical protein
VVQTCSKNLSTFKKDREDKDSAIKKRLDDLSQGLQQANAKVSDIQTQKQAADEALKKATRTDEIVNAQGAKFQELENHLADQRSLIDELQIDTTTRDDDFREWQVATESWRQATDVTLEQLRRAETSWSLEKSIMQAQTRTPRPRQELPTSGVGQESPAFSPSPLVTSKAQWYLGDQVQSKFMGEWYPG